MAQPGGENTERSLNRNCAMKAPPPPLHKASMAAHEHSGEDEEPAGGGLLYIATRIWRCAKEVPRKAILSSPYTSLTSVEPREGEKWVVIKISQVKKRLDNDSTERRGDREDCRAFYPSAPQTQRNAAAENAFAAGAGRTRLHSGAGALDFGRRSWSRFHWRSALLRLLFCWFC